MNSEELVADGLCTVKEAQEFLGCKTTKLYSLMSSGKLRYAKIGGSRRIPRKELIRLATKCLRGGWDLEE